MPPSSETNGPVPAQATGRYGERVAAAALRRSFAATWVHRMDAADAPPIVVTPDATVDLQWIRGRLRVAGPDLEPKTEILANGEIVIGLRFQPAAAAAWLGVPLSELVGRRLWLDELWGARADRIASRVRASGSVEALAASVEQVVAQDAEPRVADAPMKAAYRLIERGPPPGAPLVPWLMRSLAMSERTLRRRFGESFGYGPKTLDRILRYQRFLALSRQSDSPAAVLASEAGYADQPHLVRESRRLTGSTPRQMQGLLQAI